MLFLSDRGYNAYMAIKIVKNNITKSELGQIAKEQFGDMIKAVVDVEQEIMAIGGELHADEEVVLSEQEGSKREHTWGINIYPDRVRKDWVEFDSMVNIKPQHGNHSRDVDDSNIRKKIKKIVDKLVDE